MERIEKFLGICSFLSQCGTQDIPFPIPTWQIHWCLKKNLQVNKYNFKIYPKIVKANNIIM